MAFFYSFTDSLRQKWLNFYQSNRDWITLHMQVESVYTPDGGKRPPSYLILGVANALEPKLAQLMLPFSKLNADADTLIEVLDLHFDPEMALGNRVIPPVETQEDQNDDSPFPTEAGSEITNREITNSEITNSEITNSEITSSEITNSEIIESGLGENGEDEFDRGIRITKEFISSKEFSEASVDSVSQAGEVTGVPHQPVDESHTYESNTWESNEYEIAQDTHQSQAFASAESPEDFGDISFDAENTFQGDLEQESLENFDADDDSNQFKNVMMDVWGGESSVPETKVNKEAQSGEDKLESPFDDAEIANLFPEA